MCALKMFFCDENSIGSFCAQHNYQVKKVLKSPMPCRGCVIDVQADYRICRACGGNALRLRLMRKEQKAKRDYNLAMGEM